MMQKKQKVKNTTQLIAKQRSYKEVTTLLDGQWDESLRTNSRTMAQLDKALGSPSKKLKVISVGGSNGKSLTINFTTQLLANEGLKVGSFYAPHFTAYNERITYNNEQISNNDFTDVANEVINTAASLDLNIHAEELLTMTALYYFAQKKSDVAVLEFEHMKKFDATTICTPVITAITRFTDVSETEQAKVAESLALFKSIISKNTWVISADQNKFNLQTLETIAEEAQGKWAMPIRKLANLAYPFEQLHGRCAALAERAAQLFIQEIADANVIMQDSLLAKPKGQRGRPTLEAKRKSEINPKKTIEQYWNDTLSTLSNRFELIKDTKPMVLLDNADNIDAFQNLLLGIRLLHYDRALKGLTLIVGCENNNLLHTEFYKMVRYFFKKTSGQIIFCPVAKDAQNQSEEWHVEQITNDTKNVKVKAKSTKTFTQAFEYAQKAVDEQNGLIVITGSRAIIAEYWQTKGSKK